VHSDALPVLSGWGDEYLLRVICWGGRVLGRGFGRLCRGGRWGWGRRVWRGVPRILWVGRGGCGRRNPFIDMR